MALISTYTTTSGQANGAGPGASLFGVADIGSNSVRLVIFDASTRTPAIYFNEKVLCGLGADLERTGRLAPEGVARAQAALRRFMALTARHRLSRLVAVGTAALRDAEDGADFVARAREEIGLDIHVASAADEARLAAHGVLLGDPSADGVVADLGGASLELARLTPQGCVGDGVTSALGPLRIDGWGLGEADALDKRIDATLSPAAERRFQGQPALYALGGAWRAVFKAAMAHGAYPLSVLHGYALDAEDALATAEWAAGLAPEAVAELTGASERRAAVTPLAARVLARLVRRLAPERVVLSAFGLREGVLWEHLPLALRSRDPLIDACEASERASARAPGFGRELWEWMKAALAPFAAGEARLAEAVCLLADASWRTHPDYRARTSFELVTRNNLGGVSHQDRVFMGTALLHRYKGGRRATRTEPAITLLSPERQARAEALGRAVRLGGMLSGGARGVLPGCPLARRAHGADAQGALVLRLTGAAAALSGEEVRKRFDGLAEALGLEGELLFE